MLLDYFYEYYINYIRLIYKKLPSDTASIYIIFIFSTHFEELTDGKKLIYIYIYQKIDIYIYIYIAL